jgi:hypothetical protein
VIDGAFDEFAIVAELHAPLIIDPLEQDVTEDAGLSKPTLPPPQTSRPERGDLRVDTRLRPSIALACRGPSPTLTSESDRDETRSKSVIRSAASLSSFHLPNRARHSYRDWDTGTPDLTSASRSSLTSSSSAISRYSGLYTPPHSPSITSFIQTEILNPPGSHHLSAINELQNTENPFHDPSHLFLHSMEVKSTQTITKTTKTERSGSTSMMRNESGGLGQEEQEHNIASHGIPGRSRLDAHVYHSETNSRSSTVTNLPSAFPRSSPAVPAAASNVSFTQFPTVQSVVSLPSLLPGSAVRVSRSWSFGSKISSRSRGASVAFDKEDKKEEKRKKKEEARARKERLAQERVKGYRAWEEDIAVYGSLASM